jgi:hypothetical protein
MHTGWYARRRGILEHLECGTISLLDAAIHDFLCLIADYRTGVARASAQKIAALCPVDISLRAIQRSLARLEEIGWIKRFRTHGKRGNYPIVIGKYFVIDPSLKWKSVNLEHTSDWRDIKFDVVTDTSFVVPKAVTEVDTDVSCIQEARSEKEEADQVTGNRVTGTDDSVCCLKELDVWKFTGLDRARIPREYLDRGFESDLQSLFDGYRVETHEENECICGPDDFLDIAMDEFKYKLHKRYPPALLARKKQLEGETPITRVR